MNPHPPLCSTGAASDLANRSARISPPANARDAARPGSSCAKFFGGRHRTDAAVGNAGGWIDNLRCKTTLVVCQRRLGIGAVEFQKKVSCGDPGWAKDN